MIIEYAPTTASAIEFAAANRLEEWLHLFLCKEGSNKALSDGLKLQPRRYYPPKMMELCEFERCCGPEASMTFQVPEAAFLRRVANIAKAYEKGDGDMPPLIVCRENCGYTLSDGNHRYQALKNIDIARYWVIVWESL